MLLLKNGKPAASQKEFEKILERNVWPDRNDPAVAAEVKSYDNMPYKHYVNGELVGKSGGSK